jgi:hypothetical protein
MNALPPGPRLPRLVQLRCLGATFALFEMKTVLRVIAREAALRPARPTGEHVARRVITLVPERGTEVVMDAPARLGTRAGALEVAA